MLEDLEQCAGKQGRCSVTGLWKPVGWSEDQASAQKAQRQRGHCGALGTGKDKGWTTAQ